MTPVRGVLRQTEDYFEASCWPLGTLLAFCIARLWVVPLPSSFWVDELVTAFVVNHPNHASFAVAPQVPQSIYYWLPCAAQALTGPSEISYRIPSLLVMAIMLWLVARLAVRLIHPRAGWFAVFACLAFRGIDYHAIDARPYALGMMTAAASLLCLVTWLDSARWRDAALFVLFAAMVWRVHLLNWPFYLVLVIYAAVRLAGGDTQVGRLQWTATAAALGLALLPPALSALALVHGARSHSFVPPPTLHVFEHELHWNVALICGVVAWLLAKVLAKSRGWEKAEYMVTGSALVLMLGWWLSQPVCLYLYSRLTGNSVYVGRYLSLMLPGAAMTATAAVARWIPSHRWRVAAAGMALVVFFSQGHWESVRPRHDISDWRAAAREVNRFAQDASTPVIVTSPFIEARPPAWTPDYPLPGFLYAQLGGYPVRGRLYLFPFVSSSESLEAMRYADTLTKGLSSSGKWAIYGGAATVRDWCKWFSGRPEFVSWRNTLREFGDVYVAEFRRE